jgi:hypothetical protein
MCGPGAASTSSLMRQLDASIGLAASATSAAGCMDVYCVLHWELRVVSERGCGSVDPSCSLLLILLLLNACVRQRLALIKHPNCWAPISCWHKYLCRIGMGVVGWTTRLWGHMTHV